MSGVLACIIWAIANLACACLCFRRILFCSGTCRSGMWWRAHQVPLRANQKPPAGAPPKPGLVWLAWATSRTGLALHLQGLGWAGMDGHNPPKRKLMVHTALRRPCVCLGVPSVLSFFYVFLVKLVFPFLHFPCPCSSPTPPNTNCDGLRRTSNSPHPHVHMSARPPFLPPKIHSPSIPFFPTRWTIPCFS